MDCQMPNAVRRAVSRRSQNYFEILLNAADPLARLQARRAIERAVTQVFGGDYAALKKTRRGRARISRARQISMYLAHVACGLSLTDVGRWFARDRTTVAHACALIEDRRDNRVFDRALDLLTWAVPVMVLRPGAHTAKH